MATFLHVGRMDRALRVVLGIAFGQETLDTLRAPKDRPKRDGPRMGLT